MIASVFSSLLYVFNAVLYQARVDLGALHSFASVLNTDMDQAHLNYKKLLRLNRNSTAVLRLYAAFLLDICNDVNHHKLLMDQADQIELNGNRGDTRLATDPSQSSDNMFDPHNAVVLLNADKERTGEIISANSAAETLFGYTKNDLLGSNVALLMPRPWAQRHDQWLDRFHEHAAKQASASDEEGRRKRKQKQVYFVFLLAGLFSFLVFCFFCHFGAA